jgi:CH-like domain in sperm protein
VVAKIENFTKLQPTLRNLNIKFDSKAIDGIMKGERGAALRLLYQLKMALEKVYPPTDVNVLKKSKKHTYNDPHILAGKIGDNRPAMKIPQPKEKYEAQAHTFFHQRLQVLNKP